MNSSQFSLIFEQVYKEKHNLVVSKMLKWQEAKELFLSSTYVKNIDGDFLQMAKDNKRFQRLIHELLKVTNAEYQILSKVKPITEDKDLPKSKQAIPAISQLSLAPEDQSQFTSAIQKSHKKSTLIHELCQFSARFFAITSTELNEFKSMQSEIQNRKQRYLFDMKKEVSEQAKVREELCVKNESKYFNVKNFQRLREVLDREVKILAKTHEDARAYVRQSLEKKKQILKDCVDNMARFEELYSKVFSGVILEEIQAYFERLIEDIERQEVKFAKQQKELQLSKDQTQRQLQTLHTDNITLFTLILQQITLGEWRHIELQTSKKSSFTSFSSLSFSSNHALRQQTNYQTSNVQFQISQAKNSVVEEVFGFVMTITVDYKLVFRKESDRNRVYKELVMNDLKIKTEKEKKVSDLKAMTLTDKKTKQRINLTFPDSDKKEQFILHFDRFEQLKTTLNK